MRNLLFLLVVACATTAPPPPAGGPRGLRASEHLDAARQHDELSRERSTWPQTSTMTPGGVDTPKASPWFRTWDTTAEHERLAREHRGQAAALEAAYEDACGTHPIEHVSVSPLLRYRTGGWNTSTGVIVYLSPLAGTADELLASLRCHRAWMMLAPAAMDDCPLDLPGLQIDARGDAEGITLALSVRDRKVLAELQRRVARQIEARAHEQHEE
jgi:hypothetical protein